MPILHPVRVNVVIAMVVGTAVTAALPMVCLLASPAAMAADHAADEAVRRVCREAMAKRGLHPQTVQYENLGEAAGARGWTGQFTQDGQRHEFNCVVEAVTMHVRDLVVNPLGERAPAERPSAEHPSAAAR